MNTPETERRRVSQAALLDSALRAINQLAASRDPGTRALAVRVLAEIGQVRRQIPARREHDHGTGVC